MYIRLKEEKFGTLPPPSCFSICGHGESVCEIGTVGGSLCFCLRLVFVFHLWVMKEYGIQESWSKQFVFDDFIPAYVGETVNDTKNGNILLMSAHDLILYNP